MLPRNTAVLLCLGKPRRPAGEEQLLVFLATVSFGCYVCTAGKSNGKKQILEENNRS
jgi:hypothetical protein